MINIIICIHDALEYVKRCLESVSVNTIVDYKLILIDDASESITKEYLISYCNNKEVILIRNENKMGYTKSLNIALKYISAKYIIFLNSDTIVTPNWSDKMLKLFLNEKKLAMVGPLSNAASFQSIPSVYDKKYCYAVNPIPLGFTVDTFSLFCEKNSLKIYPEVNFINGFCMMLKSSIIKEVGIFDEHNFPDGYGEEIDYCLRVKSAGYTIRIADDTFVYHYKSKSYGKNMRNLLASKSRRVLDSKYGEQMICSAYRTIRESPDLKNIRLNIIDFLNVN